MSIKKQYLKQKPICKVTFTLPKKSVGNAKKVHLVGEFNNWDEKVSPMKKLKNGSFTTTIELEKGKQYQFRYLIDGKKWENDNDADSYIFSDFGNCDNSVVSI